MATTTKKNDWTTKKRNNSLRNKRWKNLILSSVLLYFFKNLFLNPVDVCVRVCVCLKREQNIKRNYNGILQQQQRLSVKKQENCSSRLTTNFIPILVLRRFKQPVVVWPSSGPAASSMTHLTDFLCPFGRTLFILTKTNAHWPTCFSHYDVLLSLSNLLLFLLSIF